MTTKIVAVEQDKAMIEIIKEAGDIVQRATNFLVGSEESFEESGKIIAWLAMIKKQIKERCEFFVQPLKKQISPLKKEIEKLVEKYEVYSDPFNCADKIMRDKMLLYRQQQLVTKEKEKTNARIEAEKIAKKEKISVEEVMQSVEIKEVVRITDNSTIKKIWVFEIINELKIPRKFLAIDEIGIRVAIRQGVREIAGVKIYEKEIVSLK